MDFFVGKMFWNLFRDESLNVRKLFGGIRGGIAIEQAMDALHGAGNQFVVGLRNMQKL